VALPGRREPDRPLVRIRGPLEVPRTLEDVRGLERPPRRVLARFVRRVERVQVQRPAGEGVDHDVPKVLVVMAGHAAFPRVRE